MLNHKLTHRGLAPALLALMLAACAPTTNHLYSPLVQSDTATFSPLSTGTSIDNDLAWARAASNLNQATSRWEDFIEKWSGEVEDGYVQIRVDVANLELARAYYLLGRSSDGDGIMRKLDPLQIH